MRRRLLKNILTAVSLFGLTLMSTHYAYAENSSANYSLKAGTFLNSGSSQSTASYEIITMTGMPFAGKTQGANYTVRLGGLCIYIAPVVISISIAEDALSLGSMPVGDSVVSAVPITVVNDGSGINETYSLFLTNPAGWTASQANAGMETYILNAVFDADGAGIGWDNTNHALLTIPSLCTSTKFAGDQTGVNVPYNATRKLWFQFKSPTTTSVTTEQAVTVTVTAQAS